MKYLTFILSLFIFSQCYAEPVNTVGIPLPLNDIDSVSIYIDGYSYYLNEATKVSREVKEYAVKITPVKYDVQAFIDVLNYTKNITPAQLDIIRYELARYDVTTFTDIGQWIKYIETYQAVKDYGTELKSAVSSVRVSHYIQTKDYVKLRAELAGVIPADKVQKLIDYVEGIIPTKLPPQPFFIGIGECDNLDKAKSAVIPKEIDCLLVPVYEIKENVLSEIFKTVANSDKQVILAIDFESEDVPLIKWLDKTKLQKIINLANEPLVHSVYVLWGKQNSIDIAPARFPDCARNAGKIITYLKSQAPSIYVYKTNCLLYDTERMDLWNEAMKGLKAQGDGYAIWGRYCESQFNSPLRVEGDPTILTGFFGLCDDRGYPRPFDDTDVTYMKTRLPEIVDQVGNEGWRGIVLQGLDWIKVFTK